MKDNKNCNCNHEPDRYYYFFDSTPTNTKFTQHDGRVGGIQLLIFSIIMLIFMIMK